MKKKAALLINLGSPESPAVSKVGNYLKEFLNDPRVIDIPQPWRWILVNLFIIPLRKFNSAKLYKSIWTEKGSPLIVYTESLVARLQEMADKIQPQLVFDYAMRYGKPTIHDKLHELCGNSSEILLFPLYPQYASSTTASCLDEAFSFFKERQAHVPVKTISFFFHLNFYINAKAELIQRYHPHQFDAVIFSYHGLPNRQIKKCSLEQNYCCFSQHCCESWGEKNYFCYKAQCHRTTRLLATKANIPVEKCYTAFQSRLSNDWLEPFTDRTLVELAQSGKKSVLVVSPAFVSDCLETIHELGVEYKALFLQNGGEKYEWVRALNDEDVWVKNLFEFIISQLK
ncbi:MAG: ferrochelatase [Bacteroidia bacterium]|nr:ferrochelatase [Bacteroidia bacterium]